MISKIRYGNKYSSTAAFQLGELKSFLNSKPNLKLKRSAPRLVMICGANLFDDDGKPVGLSKRREALKNFIIEKYDNIIPIFAEDVFKVLDNKNLLDVEQYMIEFCDYVLIVLESYSSLCELGAFSHNEELRKKLIIVNDSRFKDADSYINEGPLRAIREENEGRKRLLWYKMIAPTHELDSIVDIYEGLDDLFGKVDSKYVTNEKKFDLEKFSKTKSDEVSRTYMFLVHDLVLLLEPISHKELICLCKYMFGDRSYDFLKFYLGLLNAMGVITFSERHGKRLYRATSPKEYLDYSYDYRKGKVIFRGFAERYGLNENL